jgi:ribosomal protein S4
MTRKRQERKKYLSLLLQQMENLNVKKKSLLNRRKKIATRGKPTGTGFSSLSRIERGIKKIFQRNSSLLPPVFLWRGYRKNLPFSPSSQKNETGKIFKVSPFQVERWGQVKLKDRKIPFINPSSTFSPKQEKSPGKKKPSLNTLHPMERVQTFSEKRSGSTSPLPLIAEKNVTEPTQLKPHLKCNLFPYISNVRDSIQNVRSLPYIRNVGEKPSAKHTSFYGIADGMLPDISNARKGYDGGRRKKNFFGEKKKSFSISLASVSQLKGEITRLESLRKSSMFRSQLIEGRKLSLLYGKLSQRKRNRLYSILRKARKLRNGFGENFISLMEQRADILLYRVSFFPSILSARQWIRHGRVSLNGEVLLFPEYLLSPGDLLSIPIRYHRFFENLSCSNILDPSQAAPKYPKYPKKNLNKFTCERLNVSSDKQVCFISLNIQEKTLASCLPTPCFRTFSEAPCHDIFSIRGSHPTAKRMGKGQKFLFKMNWETNFYKSYQSFQIPQFSPYNFLFGAGEISETINQVGNQWNEQNSFCSTLFYRIFKKRFLLVSLLFSKGLKHFQSKQLSQRVFPLWHETVAGKTTSIQYRGNGFWSFLSEAKSDSNPSFPFPAVSFPAVPFPAVPFPAKLEQLEMEQLEMEQLKNGVGKNRQSSPPSTDKSKWRSLSYGKESSGSGRKEKRLHKKTAQDRTRSNQLFQHLAFSFPFSFPFPFPAKLEQLKQSEKQQLEKDRNRMGKSFHRPIKPVHVEVSYSCLRLIYLYPPQRVSFPTLIDLDILERSFRGKG